YLEEVLKYCNYVFTCIFVIEALLKLVAFGLHRWNQLDLSIVALSIIGITLEELKMSAALPINPTIIRIMRVLRIARVLKLLKMATGMRALLDTVMQALPQVGNLGLLFMLLFFIYAALGVELFGKLEFTHAGRAGSARREKGVQDTLRECRPEDRQCLTYLPLISPLYFVTFVLMAQFVLVNVVVAVLMKHLEESNKEAKEDRRLSTGSNHSSVGGTYVGPRPNSPGQEEEVQCTNQSLLSPRKMSVSRMHSLPNDSYMFQPVRPASAPYRVEERDVSPQHYNSGARCLPPASPTGSPPPPPPPHPPAYTQPVPQAAVKLDSVESQGCEQLLGRPRPRPLSVAAVARDPVDEEERGAFRKDPPLPTEAGGHQDDQRRHSIEICSPPPPENRVLQGPEEAPAGERGGRGLPIRVRSVGGCHHKKRLSPPCISIHPPAEQPRPPGPVAPPSPSQQLSPDRSTTLRRRALSSDLMASITRSVDSAAAARPLTPDHAPLRPHPPLTRTLTPEPYLRPCARVHVAARPLLSLT
ncbi:hypothetical protein NHX12_032214, partial [Muraenolepis orangiensis]